MKSLEISKSSWHYRFIVWRKGWEPHPTLIADSCSYWRLLMAYMFGLFLQGLAITLGAIVFVFACVILPIHGVGYYFNWWNIGLAPENAIAGLWVLAFEGACAAFVVMKVRKWDVKAINALEAWQDRRSANRGEERKPNAFAQLYRASRERMCSRVELVD